MQEVHEIGREVATHFRLPLGLFILLGGRYIQPFTTFSQSSAFKIGHRVIVCNDIILGFDLFGRSFIATISLRKEKLRLCI
jgi:hypothetical protein